MGRLTLQVRQDRECSFSTDLFSRYKCSEKVLALVSLGTYVAQVSTRKVA